MHLQEKMRECIAFLCSTSLDHILSTIIVRVQLKFVCCNYNKHLKNLLKITC